MTQSERRAISAGDWIRTNPLRGVDGLSGATVHYVGQGDAISIVDLSGAVVARIDYGGREGRPFAKSKLQRKQDIDAALPVTKALPIFLTHWDEDHWCSAVVGGQAMRHGSWITPRQLTSPRAAVRSTLFHSVKCVPAALEQTVICFEAVNGDQLWCEKIGRFDRAAMNEDCNQTGMAFSLIKRTTQEVILLPGDAPIHTIPHYRTLRQRGARLRGLVAYHHGAWTHGVEHTSAFLADWTNRTPRPDVIFSCGDPNSYDHPHPAAYAAAMPDAVLNRPRSGRIDILF